MTGNLIHFPRNESFKPEEEPDLDSNQCILCGREKMKDSDLCEACEKMVSECDD